MNDIAVTVDNVSKKFRLFNSPRMRFFEAIDPFSRTFHREFWALKQICFEVARGTSVGIMGRNGSGKSTLLQILCSVMKPTSGYIHVNGRISALLELGADFNPEMTGRENVVWKGIRMGMKKKAILARCPEIEAYADIGEFFDQPVKIYSSGMFVRMAFATAIHVDPDILVVDEALAVGDAKFQHKCFQTFRRFLDAGKTLVLVSHDVGTLLRLCDQGVVLDEGQAYFKGAIAQATNKYQALLFGNPRQTDRAGATNDLPDTSHPSDPSISEQKPYQDHWSDTQPAPMVLMRSGILDNCRNRSSYNKHETRLGDGRMQILDYIIAIPGKIEPAHIPHDAEIEIYVKFHFFEELNNVCIGFAFISKDSLYVYGTNLAMQCKPLLSGHAGETLIAKIVCNPTLVGGDYFLNLGCSLITPQQEVYLDVRRSIAHLKVNDTPWCTGFLAAESTLEVMERFVH